MHFMVKQNLLLCVMVSAMFVGSSVQAEQLSVQDMQNVPSLVAESPVLPANAISQKNWVYKSLKDLSYKYGLVFGTPDSKVDGTKPLSRNDAAVLLVNLVGRIENDKLKLSEAEKERVEILKEELKTEIDKLTLRVSNVETSVETLKGSVSNLEESDSKTFKAGFGKEWGIGGDIQLKYTGNIRKGDGNYSSGFELIDTDFNMYGRLAKHLEYSVGATLNTPVDGSWGKGLVYDAFVKTDLIPKHTLYIGQMVKPIGQEGTQSSVALDTIDRAQISRNFGNQNDLGLKIRGDRKYLEYYVGMFNGQGRLTADVDNRPDIGSWFIVKPLANKPKLGVLHLGGGYYNGSKKLGDGTKVANSNYGFYSMYKYKRYTLKGEYSHQNGYGDVISQKAKGWYVTNLYDLTDKIQLVAKVDRFDPSSFSSDDSITEYTVGTNYFLKDNNLKFQVNYVHVDPKALKSSDRIMVMSQYLF